MSSRVFKLISEEAHRQKYGLEMIPSENYTSEDVMKAMGSILTNKYSEGFPKARYYGGNQVIDKIEIYAQDLANKVFGTAHAIVQPYSGSPANFAITLALVKPGETLMGQALPMGGHLTHGAPASYTGKLFNSVQYGVGKDWKIDMEEVRALAKKHKPKLIWVGTTAYMFILDYKGFAKIAEEVGAYLVADIAHVSGLIAGGVHPSPVPYVDIVMTTTHKTLRGPRGAIILVTKKGLKKDPELPQKLEKAVFPGLQGGPHDHQTAAIAVCLEEVLEPSFKKYAEQIVKNAKVLANKLGTKTYTHLILLSLEDYGFGMGYQAQYALEEAGITINKNTIPGEPASAFYPSGIRLGTPALTTRGMREKDMIKIAGWIKRVLEEIRGLDLPKEQEKRKDFLKEVKGKLRKNKNLKLIRKDVEKFAGKFPVPGID
ncbi:MAG: glycine hydroxymethyltransferase [Microgenomates group bacterium Gr01-1014_7]|nr:MAG: glycine hydroxymethyltransferase [Microgenomates group bacterium Gr01-1014_7]